ncbi:hypothetical protein [Knoellia sp. LjRoot47]|uniref:hypothetical protein n=1 Tax=Knoellia sp. LjRoot47 TaxID=3342330 RepID=UPI003ECFB947
MKRIITSTAIAGLALAAATATAGPAQANDKVLRIYNAAGTKVLAKAWYDDLTDNLCVRSYVAGQMAVVKIGPSGGGTFDQAQDAGFGKSTNCTGNMSVAEDRLFWMNLSYPGRPSKDTTFYT